jgi:hypothetical protein
MALMTVILTIDEAIMERHPDLEPDALVEYHTTIELRTDTGDVVRGQVTALRIVPATP